MKLAYSLRGPEHMANDMLMCSAVAELNTNTLQIQNNKKTEERQN